MMIGQDILQDHGYPEYLDSWTRLLGSSLDLDSVLVKPRILRRKQAIARLGSTSRIFIAQNVWRIMRSKVPQATFTSCSIRHVAIGPTRKPKANLAVRPIGSATVISPTRPGSHRLPKTDICLLPYSSSPKPRFRRSRRT